MDQFITCLQEAAEAGQRRALPPSTSRQSCTARNCHPDWFRRRICDPIACLQEAVEAERDMGAAANRKLAELPKFCLRCRIRQMLSVVFLRRTRRRRSATWSLHHQAQDGGFYRNLDAE